MADLVITTSQVLPASSAGFDTGTAGVTITAGQSVYFDTVSGTYKLADSNDTVATAVVAGVALNNASTGQPVKVETTGVMTLGAGASVGVGTIYAQSRTPGAICPVADLASGDRVSVLGVGLSGGRLALNIHNSGAQVP